LSFLQDLRHNSTGRVTAHLHFSNKCSFSQFFHKASGMSPTQFRREPRGWWPAWCGLRSAEIACFPTVPAWTKWAAQGRPRRDLVRAGHGENIARFMIFKPALAEELDLPILLHPGKPMTIEQVKGYERTNTLNQKR
jgi:hypothetical protein